MGSRLTAANAGGPGAVGHSTGPARARREGTYAVHSDQSMFQPLRPLSGWITLSLEFLTTTTSPISELSKSHAAGVLPSQPPRTSRRPTQPWLVFVVPKMPDPPQ